MDFTAAASTLCRACGLCCDGTLFTAVPLTADDRVPAPAGATRLPQPCAHLVSRCCQVYERRPLACRRFDCNLLHALRDGEVTAEGALAIVGEAHRRVEAAMAAADLPQRSQVVATPAHPACAAAITYLQVHFTRLQGPGVRRDGAP